MSPAGRSGWPDATRDRSPRAACESLGTPLARKVRRQARVRPLASKAGGRGPKAPGDTSRTRVAPAARPRRTRDPGRSVAVAGGVPLPRACARAPADALVRGSGSYGGRLVPRRSRPAVALVRGSSSSRVARPAVTLSGGRTRPASLPSGGRAFPRSRRSFAGGFATTPAGGSGWPDATGTGPRGPRVNRLAHLRHERSEDKRRFVR
jgi:hypothetical protein